MHTNVLHDLLTQKGTRIVPDVYRNGNKLVRVDKSHYPIHISNESLNDNDYIALNKIVVTIRNHRKDACIAMRDNMLAMKFVRCSNQIKITLCKAYS